MYKFHNSPPPGGGNEIQPKKFGERNSRGKKFKGKKEKKEGKKEKKEERKKKRGKKEKKNKEKEGKKRRGKEKEEESLSKFLKINRYLKLKVRVSPRGSGGSFVDGKNW